MHRKVKWTERKREEDVEGRKMRNLRRECSGRRGKGKEMYKGR
jgi:hypothetical protein